MPKADQTIVKVTDPLVKESLFSSRSKEDSAVSAFSQAKKRQYKPGRFNVNKASNADAQGQSGKSSYRQGKCHNCGKP